VKDALAITVELNSLISFIPLQKARHVYYIRKDLKTYMVKKLANITCNIWDKECYF